MLKLQTHDIEGRIFNWIKRFLSNGTQQVNVSGIASKEAAVTNGIPQGSVLGPLSFLIYINDFATVCREPRRHQTICPKGRRRSKEVAARRPGQPPPVVRRLAAQVPPRKVLRDATGTPITKVSCTP